MKSLNTLCIALFGLIGITALACAIFCKAYHHIGTAVMCTIMVLASIKDNERQE